MKKYPFTKQNDIKDCGAACLSMIIKYYGGYIGLNKLNQLIKTDKNGSTAYNIVEAAKYIGLNASGIKINFCDINQITVPFIAHTIIDNTISHFIVVYKIDLKKKILIVGDPAKKIYKIKFEDFQKIFQNIVLTFDLIHKLPKYEKENYLQIKIKKFIKENKIVFIKLILYSLIITLLTIVSSFYIKLIISNIYITPITLFIIFSSILIIKNILEYIQNKIYININNNLDLYLTNDVFSKIILLPYAYYKNKSTGDVVARFNDITKIKEVISKIFIILFVDGILSISSIICLFLISKTLSLLVILISIVTIIITILYKNIFINCLENIKIKQSNINSFVIESIMGFETIKGLSIENNTIKSFNKKYLDFLGNTKLLSNLQNKENLYKTLINDIGFNLIILIGVLYIFPSNDISNLILFISLSNYFFNPIKNILENYELLKETKISVDRINELIIDSKENNINKKITNIKINNLDFYHNNKLILKNIKLNINKKDKIAFIGQSGTGKSTLLKIIKGYYENDKITYNNLKSINLSSISYISQNELLFTDTIYNNIVLNRNISENDLKKVCDICLVDEIIKKNKLGFNTLIEENGFNLSGGEKQRIILARTMLQNSDVILIDEGLSQVDVSKERIILKNILKNYSDKIIIFVTHRLDNVDLFNKLFKSEKNHIIEIKKCRNEV